MTCPYCGTTMCKAFVIISGGVWLSASRARMEAIVELSRSGEAPSPSIDGESPMHCVIGASGHALGNWPKEGLYCCNCFSFLVRPQP